MPASKSDLHAVDVMRGFSVRKHRSRVDDLALLLSVAAAAVVAASKADTAPSFAATAGTNTTVSTAITVVKLTQVLPVQ